ncbi:NAD(P)/FAD-dependent oxidoreductase [Desulfococcus sp.]|uniref:NAD(P)/FAD-dependent oxidoreductase n=1 Tax=Desulfococcus sp. TaxID=2025834 RepID=UPI003594712C
MRIAVIGSGISGLTAARLLSAEHEVTVFEAGGYVGGHTHTVDVVFQGRTYAVDTGFIVFNDRTYPNFVALMRRLGVGRKPSNMSFGVKCEKTGLEYSPSTPGSLFCQRRNLVRPSFYRMIADIFRFRRTAGALLASGDDDLTLGDYLSRNGYSRAFIQHFIIPMGAAVWSADTGGFADFPARLFVEFFTHHGFLSIRNQPQWYVIQGGSRAYIPPLTAPFKDRIRLNTPVRALTRHPDHAALTFEGGEREVFDQAVVATHSDQALALLADPSEDERRILGEIPYRENRVVLHTDTAVLPENRKAWASWNYRIPREDTGESTVTYNMNLLQGLQAPATFCVSLNPAESVRPDRILQTFSYHHPVYTPRSLRARRERDRINGVNRTWFCGAYWGYGFHEDGVNSALAVCTHFGKGIDHA